ncbi:hypothetical protein BLNAU_2087 [Blattamonas nauphoetae]|uniref:Uncharacterized protein n=1 Tax=Blattamonas nauphoetae TaxID=2049346 RepID=A0ABQ9YHJ6_9EUKA|nr:hypothetical protein BLNAU_2087 [Blattamonas nauphoetae]
MLVPRNMGWTERGAQKRGSGAIGEDDGWFFVAFGVGVGGGEEGGEGGIRAQNAPDSVHVPNRRSRQMRACQRYNASQHLLIQMRNVWRVRTPNRTHVHKRAPNQRRRHSSNRLHILKRCSCQIREESNQHPTIDTQTDPTRDANGDVSTTPRIDPTSFHSKLFEITTDDSLPDSSNGDPEITIALVHGDTSILLEDIVSMLLDTTASLGDLSLFICCLLSAELSISEKSIHFNDSVELVKLNMQLSGV